MRYIIMAAGQGKRWHNHLGVPKHLIEIGGETLLARTTRLLKENGIEDYIITCSDERYKQYGETTPQTHNDCEIDRFEEFEDKEVCYLYGDVYYTEEAMRTIVNTNTDDILFFGSPFEIFAIKIVNKKDFFRHKAIVKDLYLNGKIDRCIGWEVYRSMYHIPFNEHKVFRNYCLLLDDTDDIDFPEDYEEFLRKRND